jgi:hypothetical protein
MARLQSISKRIKPSTHHSTLCRFPNVFCQKAKCRNWTAVYSRFIKSPNFRGWLVLKEREANIQLLRLYLEQVCGAEVAGWCKGKAELEIMDCFIRIRDAVRYFGFGLEV